jgi:GDP-mannose 6-dehydrogenase
MMKVAVFGLGYVGTVTAACLAANGHEVWGVDVDANKVGAIQSGRSPVVEPGLSELVEMGWAAGSLHATMSARQAVDQADVSLICVGTPSTAQGGANLTYVDHVVEDLTTCLIARPPEAAKLHCVVMRSTVPPGTVETIGATLCANLAGSGQSVGVAMCPEFLREGTGIADFYSPPYTVIGAVDDSVVNVVSDLFGFIGRPMRIVDIRTAEALKYACNAFHATKVSFANELGRIFRRLDIDSRKVMELFCEDDQLNISSRYLRPGFAFGGSCLPKDLRSILHLARIENVDLPLLAGSLASNRLSVSDVVERVLEGDGRTVAVLGLSFKADSDDLRESPYVELAETLLGKGFDVRIYDPIVNPSTLIGTNRVYVESRLPHLRKILTDRASDALAGADVAIVSSSDPEVIVALEADPPAQIVDLDGRLGRAVEALAGYQGVAW